MSALGWRSWLAAAAFLLWLLAGIAASVLLVAAGSASVGWAFAGVPLAGVLLPALALTSISPAPLPPQLPAGQTFHRSPARLALATVFGLLAAALALALLPIGIPLLIAAAADARAAGDTLMMLMAGACVVGMVLVALPASLLLPILWLRAPWRQRRWPFAILGQRQLWLDGTLHDWADISAAALRQTRSGVFLLIETHGGSQAFALFQLAGKPRALYAAINGWTSGQRIAGKR